MLQKKDFFVLLWGPLFVGATVWPNMLNMPKSASVLMNRQCPISCFTELYMLLQNHVAW